jgi:hypothetical protein
MILRCISVLRAREWDAFESTTPTFLSLDRTVSHQSAIVNHVIISTVFNLLQLGLSFVACTMTHKGHHFVTLCKENRQYVIAWSCTCLQ